MSNFWNADRCIDYICKNTKSTYSDYIFYENLYGYNFKSLSSLFSEDPKNTIKFEIQEPYLNIDNVQQYQFNSFFDDLMWRKRGMFGNTLYKLSNDEYKFEIDQKDIEIIDDDINHSGSNRLYNNDVIDGLNDVLVDMNEDPNINIVRTTHFNLLNRYNLIVNLNGDLNRNVGEIYNLDFPSLDNESGNPSLIIDLFNLIDYIKPATIVGHNLEEFDIPFVLGRAKILGINMFKIPTGLNPDLSITRRPNTSVKFGNSSQKYTSTQMWGYSEIDTLHAAKRTAEVNSDIKSTNLLLPLPPTPIQVSYVCSLLAPSRQDASLRHIYFRSSGRGNTFSIKSSISL
jgi:hypothetical protein